MTPREKLQDLRSRARCSTREAAAHAGVSHATIANIERHDGYLDETNPRHRDIVRRLAKLYRVQPEDIWAPRRGVSESVTVHADKTSSSLFVLLLDIAMDGTQDQSRRDNARAQLIALARSSELL